MELAFLNRTLDQELAAIARGASLECLVCGEFVLHGRGGVIACPECGLLLQPAGVGATATSRGQGSRSAG
ncbi:MAG: hypothetical protein H0V94_07285 [Actinobacteria bacterium]|nr:hypothetical protein [Actinomycetota bacterium]